MTTLNLQVGASLDDATERDDGSAFDSTGNFLRAQSNSSGGTRANFGARFPIIAIPPGATINSASMQLFLLFDVDNPHLNIYSEDLDDAPDFSDPADVTSRATDSVTISWDEDDAGTGFQTSPLITTIIQQLVDRPGWVKDNAVVMLVNGKTTPDASCTSRSWDSVTSEAPKLDIDFKPGGLSGRVASSRGIMRGTRRGVM